MIKKVVFFSPRTVTVHHTSARQTISLDFRDQRSKANKFEILPSYKTGAHVALLALRHVAEHVYMSLNVKVVMMVIKQQHNQ